MKLFEAFDSLLDCYPDDAGGEVAGMKAEIDKIICEIDERMRQLEQTAQVLYAWGLEDLKQRDPRFDSGARASQLLKGLHTVKDACLLTVPRIWAE